MPPAVKWPLHSDYREAVQNPGVCFKDRELKLGTVPRDRLGLPRVAAGNFGCVFRLNLPGGVIKGVKCFTRVIGDRERRYRAVADFLKQHPLDATMRFDYRPGDIIVRGNAYPLLVMEWIEGRTLDAYTESIVRGSGDRRELLDIADEFYGLIKRLQDAGAAHGDLQHGNIIVTADRLRLVDLDGMFVPAIAGLGAAEVGLPDYQHPKRGRETFGPGLDGFAALVIYLSLIALRDKPELWDKFHDDNLIFKRKDFINPAGSEVFRQLKGAKDEVKRLAEALELACAAPPLGAPTLSSLINKPPSKTTVRIPALKFAITDAFGNDLQGLPCTIVRLAAGQHAGHCSFTVQNQGGGATQFVVSVQEPWLRKPDPSVFTLQQGEKRKVTLEVSYRGKQAPTGGANVAIGASAWYSRARLDRTLHLSLIEQESRWARSRKQALKAPLSRVIFLLCVLGIAGSLVSVIKMELDESAPPETSPQLSANPEQPAEEPSQPSEDVPQPSDPSAEAADPAAIETELGLGEDTIRTVQQILTAQSFDTHGIDGIIGPKTRQAIILYQREHGLSETGYLDMDLLTQIMDDADDDK